MYKLYCDYCGKEIKYKKEELFLYNGWYERSVGGNYLDKWELHKACYNKALTQIKQIFSK